MNNKQF